MDNIDTYYVLKLPCFGRGLFGWMSNVLTSLHYIDTIDPNAKIFVDIRSNDYGEESINNLDAWNPWFKPLCSESKSLIYFLEKQGLCKVIDIGDPREMYIAMMGQTIVFGNLLDFRPAVFEKARKTYLKHIHVHDFIQRDIDEFCNKKLAGKKTLAVHVRGTDKWSEYAREPNESIFRQIQEWVSTKGYEQVYLCTDEKSTVKYFQDRIPAELGIPIIVSDAFRMDSKFPVYMVNRENYLSAETQAGLMKGVVEEGYTNFQKGYDVIFDVFTMARCQGLLRWRSNVSDWVLVVTDSIQESKFLHADLPTTYKH